MKRIIRIFVTLMTVVLAATAARADIFDVANRVSPDSVPAELTAVRDLLLARPPLCATFAETRRFPFRRDPVVMEGRSIFMPGKALLLAYDGPDARQILLDDGGLFEIGTEDTLTARPLPAQYENLFSMYNMDVASLGRDFTLYFENGEAGWTLGIERVDMQVRPGKASPVPTRTLGIIMRGVGGELRSMSISRGASVNIDIVMNGSRPLDEVESSRMERLLAGKDEE